MRQVIILKYFVNPENFSHTNAIEWQRRNVKDSIENSVGGKLISWDIKTTTILLETHDVIYFDICKAQLYLSLPFKCYLYILLLVNIVVFILTM